MTTRIALLRFILLLSTSFAAADFRKLLDGGDYDSLNALLNKTDFEKIGKLAPARKLLHIASQSMVAVILNLPTACKPKLLSQNLKC